VALKNSPLALPVAALLVMGRREDFGSNILTSGVRTCPLGCPEPYSDSSPLLLSPSHSPLLLTRRKCHFAIAVLKITTLGFC
jgi:hypothetical protein